MSVSLNSLTVISLSNWRAEKKIGFSICIRNGWKTGVQILGLDMLEHFRYSQHKIETELIFMSNEGSITLKCLIRFYPTQVRLKELQKYH